MHLPQPNLFAQKEFPAGFQYQASVISEEDERFLIAHFQQLPFMEFEFHGFVGKRRVVSYGWRYDFNQGGLKKAEAIPGFVLPVREKAAGFAGLEPSEFEQVLLTEYRPGATIGWHRDRSVFAEVIGISLVSSCVFRFRRKAAHKWERASLVAEPRSAYLLQGPSRTQWEHSIPAVDRLRYSITFRRLARRPD